MTRSRLISASASAGSKASCATQHPPAASVAPTAVLKPAVQNSGSAVHIRVCSWRPKIRACTHICWAGARWAWSIPLGALVVPGAEDDEGGVVGPGAGQAAVELVVADGVGARQEPAPAVLAHHRDQAQRREVGLERPDVVAEAPRPGAGPG